MRALFRAALYIVLASPLPAAIAAGCSSTESSGGTGAASSQSTASTASSQSTASAATSTGGSGSGATGGLGFGGGSGLTGGAGGTTGVGGGFTGFGDTQCTDGIDNDGDGLIDAFDPQCTGPLDNDESSFATGIPGDNSDPCKQDCFFDGNSGSGNDGCLWNLACDPANPGAPDCPYDPDKNNCPPPPSQKCLDSCSGLTPNGCDCFGCCQITLPDKTTVTVELGDGCDQAHLTDPNFCKPCTQQQGCLNPCDPCEICLGKTELPPECTPDGGAGGAGGAGSTSNGAGGGISSTCPSGEQPCNQNNPCPVNYYCLTGCCIQIPN